MPLSEYEQRILAQMEQQLSSDDPKLAESFAVPVSGASSNPRRIGLGVAVVALGLAVLVFGLVQGMSWLGIVGFLVMFGGVLLGSSRSGGTGSGAPKGGGSDKAAGPQGTSAFMSRLDERWDRRREER